MRKPRKPSMGPGKLLAMAAVMLLAWLVDRHQVTGQAAYLLFVVFAIAAYEARKKPVNVAKTPRKQASATGPAFDASQHARMMALVQQHATQSKES